MQDVVKGIYRGGGIESGERYEGDKNSNKLDESGVKPEDLPPFRTKNEVGIQTRIREL